MTQNEYKIKLWFVNLKSDSPVVLLLLPLAFLLVYLIACIVLYAFVELTGLLEFSWVNGLWTLILLTTVSVIFGKSD